MNERHNGVANRVLQSENCDIYPVHTSETRCPGRFFQHIGVLVSYSGANMRRCGYGSILHDIDPVATTPVPDDSSSMPGSWFRTVVRT